MLIAFIVYLVVGVLAVVAAADFWMCGVLGWSLLRAVFTAVCVVLVAPICLVVGCVVLLAVLVGPLCLVVCWVLGI